MDENEDEVFLEQVRAALSGAQVADRHRQAARGAFAWRTIDEELLALSFDSLVQSQSLVRSAATTESVRVLSFEGGGVQLEVELEGGRLTGQVLPGQACRITIQSPTEQPRTVLVDDSGFIEVDGVPNGPLRFRLELHDEMARVLISPWLA